MIDHDRLMAMPIPAQEQAYGWKDCALYALGLGVGLDPTCADDLSFLLEDRIRAMPTMPAVLGRPALVKLDTGIDWIRTVHGEQGLTLHRPLPPKARIRAQSRFTQVIDKGEGRGALFFVERQLSDAETGELLATVRQTLFARANGGFGGPTSAQPAAHVLPDRAPDMTQDSPSSPQAALIYRLSGDMNPLHADPTVAARAGFDRPILHGLASYGMAGRAILRAHARNDPSRLLALDARFTAPAWPGETFRTEMWHDGAVIGFRVRCVERDVVVLDNGRAEVSDTPR
ncbi:MaoC/PaaZ C-terminal domain-containing protein [Frigidibacter albus]|uniref:MaoC/PaaZ C-terminal domain-containing protein n=1 Tax=Frigidibacter albus TaxID=1465486 RepID=UPI001E382F84|nr:MaoC/PaaZ C-terminal domain-containing protein [Frigidibacter albus]